MTTEQMTDYILYALQGVLIIGAMVGSISILSSHID